MGVVGTVREESRPHGTARFHPYVFNLFLGREPIGKVIERSCKAIEDATVN